MSKVGGTHNPEVWKVTEVIHKWSGQFQNSLSSSPNRFSSYFTNLTKPFHSLFLHSLLYTLKLFSSFSKKKKPCNYPVAGGHYNKYCWWRTEDYSSIFISLCSPLPTFVLTSRSQATPSRLKHALVCLFYDIFFFFFLLLQLINATSQVTNLRWVTLFPLSVKRLSWRSALERLYRAHISLECFFLCVCV